MNIKFLNVDLDIESKQDISLMLKELGENILILHHEQNENFYFARLEIDRDVFNADKTINYFCDLIENLSENSRITWGGCISKIFDIGYESGKQQNNFTSKINSRTVKRIAKIGASLNITIYSINND